MKGFNLRIRCRGKPFCLQSLVITRFEHRRLFYLQDIISFKLSPYKLLSFDNYSFFIFQLWGQNTKVPNGQNLWYNMDNSWDIPVRHFYCFFDYWNDAITKRWSIESGRKTGEFLSFFTFIFYFVRDLIIKDTDKDAKNH